MAASVDGKPPCPRRVAAFMKQELDLNNEDSSNFNLLVLTGITPGQTDDGTKSLTNPVYDTSSNSILVWAATLKANGPTFAADGSVLSPNILDPKFSTDWIQCSSYPFTPRDPGSHYFHKGCLMEGDQVEIVASSSHQTNTKSDGASVVLPIAGTLTKINVTGQFPLQPVTKDLCPSGT